MREEVAVRRRRSTLLRRPAVQARDHREGAVGDASAKTPARPAATRRLAVPQPASTATRRRSSTCAAARTCRRTERLGAFKLTQGGGRLLAGRREGPDAPAHLRHRVGVEGRARRAPPPARGGRAARPPQARRRARPVLVPRGDRLGPRGVPPEGRDSSAASWRTTRGSATRRPGYSFVNTPHITKARPVRDVRATSTGSPTACSRRCTLDEGSGEGATYYLKPMNCPFHILIYRSRTRSYRELPLRLFEFGTVYRYEKSGVVHGLTRVRGMTQDDAHIFCTKRADGRRAALAARRSCSTCCATSASTTSTSSCPPSRRARRSAPTRSGTEATEALRVAVAMGKGLDLVLDEGGGAFYGPKISVQARDAIGRTWQMSTIQLDFQMPQRFDLAVRRRRQRAPPADHDPPRPVRLDRAVLRDPPRALRGRVPGVARARCRSSVLPVADRHDAYADRIVDRLRGRGVPRRDARRPARTRSSTRIRRAKTGEGAVRPRGRRPRRRGTARSASTPGGATTPSATCRSTTSCERLAAEVAAHA